MENVEISLLLRDFQAEWESPVFGLFRGAPFSTALLPLNSAMEPQNQAPAMTVVTVDVAQKP